MDSEVIYNFKKISDRPNNIGLRDTSASKNIVFRSVCDNRQSRTQRKSEPRSTQSRRRDRRMWGPSTERRWKFFFSFPFSDRFECCIVFTSQWLPQTILNHSSTRSRSLRSLRRRRNLRRRTRRTARGSQRSIRTTQLHVSPPVPKAPFHYLYLLSSIFDHYQLW